VCRVCYVDLMAVRLFWNGLQQWREGFQLELGHQLEVLQIDPLRLPILDVDPVPIPSRCLALYFADGSFEPPEQVLDSLQMYLEAEIPVIPVLDSTADADRKLPEILRKLNAFALGQGNYKALVDEVLSQIWLARTSRKIFISYKRSDSHEAAHALRDLLTGKGFEVFLDDATITAGKDFQRELSWWLNDADCVLLLASPNFTSSQWVMKEIQFATINSVGLLAVVWPKGGGGRTDPALLSSLMEDQIFSLETADLQGAGAASTLTGAAAVRLLERLAEVRARLVQRRLLNLLGLLQENVRRPGYTLEQLDRLGDFELNKDGESTGSYLRVLPFRPTVEAIDELRRDVSRLTSPPSRALLFYQENDARDRRLAALQWLLEPIRDKERPATYRLMPYNGAPLPVEDLL
jgi:TIR domain